MATNVCIWEEAELVTAKWKQMVQNGDGGAFKSSKTSAGRQITLTGNQSPREEFLKY